jgi:hypothetical protein
VAGWGSSSFSEGRMGRKAALNHDENSLRAGRDEMNLLEHSVFGADKKPDMDTRSLSFTAWDNHPETGEPVERSWKVTFSSDFGRPTPKDDDVYVALLKVTQQAGLMEQRTGQVDLNAARVPFSSYQLIRSLRWPENGASYKAIDDAFNRIGGVWIVAKNYWWDNIEKEYVDRKFGIIDDVFLYERDKYDRALKKARLEGRDRPLSWFRWSEVMLESFQAGYVRKLDMAVYNSLEHPIARKLYRYLGKQFWFRSRHSIELQQLCHEKLGYRHNETRHPRLRQKVQPAIQELERKGVYGLTHKFNASYGRCEVVFLAKNKTGEMLKPTAASSPLVERLVNLGVDRKDAQESTARLTSERINADIEHAEYLAIRGLIKTSKAGLLATMLKSEQPWQRPAGFVSTADRVAAAKRAAEAHARKEQQVAAVAAKQQALEQEQEAAFAEFMAAFPSEQQRRQFERTALEANALCWERYEQARECGDSKKMSMYLKTALQLAWKNAMPPKTPHPLRRT